MNFFWYTRSDYTQIDAETNLVAPPPFSLIIYTVYFLDLPVWNVLSVIFPTYAYLEIIHDDMIPSRERIEVDSEKCNGKCDGGWQWGRRMCSWEAQQLRFVHSLKVSARLAVAFPCIMSKVYKTSITRPRALLGSLVLSPVHQVLQKEQQCRVLSTLTYHFV